MSEIKIWEYSYFLKCNSSDKIEFISDYEKENYIHMIL